MTVFRAATLRTFFRFSRGSKRVNYRYKREPVTSKKLNCDVLMRYPTRQCETQKIYIKSKFNSNCNGTSHHCSLQVFSMCITAGASAKSLANVQKLLDKFWHTLKLTLHSLQFADNVGWRTTTSFIFPSDVL